MLSRDFKEFIESLNSDGVKYLVVGGYALAAHGHPRYADGVEFDPCFARRHVMRVGELDLPIIHIG